jgi:tRNA 2-thiouridine synthesizing protein A
MNQKPLEPDALLHAPPVDDRFDAGEMGCGELIIKLKVRMQRLQPSQVLHLIALDNGAIEDLPAWCRMTGHQLKMSQHPNYLIERRME